MVKVTVFVQASEHENDTHEMGTYELAGVPREGEKLVAKGAIFTVKSVTWSSVEQGVSIAVKNDTYGFDFPAMDGLIRD